MLAVTTDGGWMWLLMVVAPETGQPVSGSFHLNIEGCTCVPGVRDKVDGPIDARSTPVAGCRFLCSKSERRYRSEAVYTSNICSPSRTMQGPRL